MSRFAVYMSRIARHRQNRETMATISTLIDGKKIQKVTDVVTGTGSVVRAVSFQRR
jgi:hypothetical protein